MRTHLANSHKDNAPVYEETLKRFKEIDPKTAAMLSITYTGSGPLEGNGDYISIWIDDNGGTNLSEFWRIFDIVVREISCTRYYLALHGTEGVDVRETTVFDRNAVTYKGDMIYATREGANNAAGKIKNAQRLVRDIMMIREEKIDHEFNELLTDLYRELSEALGVTIITAEQKETVENA